MSEDLQKISGDDSKCSRLLRKVIHDEESFDLCIQEFEAYLEKSDNRKVIKNLLFSEFRSSNKFFLSIFYSIYYELSSTVQDQCE